MWDNLNTFTLLIVMCIVVNSISFSTLLLFAQRDCLVTSLIVYLMLQMYFITVTANKVTFLYNNKEVLHIVSFMKDLYNNTITTSMPSTRYNIH